MEDKLIISRDKIDMLKEYLSIYKPYSKNDKAITTFDGDCDKNRVNATIAKKILDDIETHPEKYLIQ